MKKHLLSLLIIMSLPAVLRSQDAVLVKDINPNGSSMGQRLFAYNDRLYFSAHDGDNKQELWSSDGTTAGTQLFKQINPEKGSYPGQFVRFKDKIFFTAYHPLYGTELWSSDGTEAGTQLFMDIRPNREGGYYGMMKVLPGAIEGESLYFLANDGTHGAELWTSGGTLATTRMIYDCIPGSGDPDIRDYNVLLFDVYHNARTTSKGSEPWKYNFINQTGSMLRDINTSGPDGSTTTWDSNPKAWTPYNGKMYFIAGTNHSVPNGEGLWVTDGSNAGTKPAGNTSHFADDMLIRFNGKLYYTARLSVNNAQTQIWSSDDTVAGTRQTISLAPAGHVVPRTLTILGDKLIFSANDGIYGFEPWVTDGTQAGTHILKDITPAASSNPFDFTVANGKVYFWTGNSSGRYDLYETDGTEANTIIAAADLDTVRAGSITGYQGTVFFIAGKNNTGLELYKAGKATNSVADYAPATGTNAVLYPNPAGKTCTLQYTLQQSSKPEIVLTDLTGRRLHIWEQGITRAQGRHTVQLNLPAGIPSGVYLVQINADGQQSRIKLLHQKQ